jgi:hypothetical protein
MPAPRDNTDIFDRSFKLIIASLSNKALKNRTTADAVILLPFPRAIVIYLEAGAATPDELTVRLIFPDGGGHDFTVLNLHQVGTPAHRQRHVGQGTAQVRAYGFGGGPGDGGGGRVSNRPLIQEMTARSERPMRHLKTRSKRWKISRCFMIRRPSGR